MGAWSRTQETTEAIRMLWGRGYVATGAVLARLLFEIWAASKYFSDALSTYIDKHDLEKLQQKVNKIIEGVRSEVLMPWGAAAAETPVHVLDTIRGLRGICPDAMEKYEDLCESAHANQPRFMEWWFLGKMGDNWTNETVQQRGHDLMARTTGAIEIAVSGVKIETITGLAMCGELYCGLTSGVSSQAAAKKQ
jgi:hypothetical protein